MKKQLASLVLSHLSRRALLLVLLFVSPTWMPKLATCAPTASDPGQVYRIDGPLGSSCNQWIAGMPYPSTIARYGFAQTATHFYVFGGVSDGFRVNTVNRMDISTGIWQARAPMPFTSEAPTCALMPSTTLVYCTEGETGSGFARYDIATDSWTSLASIPGGEHYGSASGAFNGKVFVAGGTTSFSTAVQVYDVSTDSWSAGTSAPGPFLLAGYQQVGQYLYVVGGYTQSGPNSSAGEQTSVLSRSRQPSKPNTPDANSTNTYRLDMSSAAGAWSTGPAFTQARADFALAYDPGTNTLYALGGDANGGSFFDSTNLVDELSLASWPAGTWNASPPNLNAPARQANQAGFNGAGQIWSAGGVVGQPFQFLTEVQHRPNTCSPAVTSAVSRKIHGGAGTFDIPMPLTGSSGVECRTNGGTNDFTLVVTFTGNVTVTGSPQAQVTSGTGCVGSSGVCNGNVSVSGAVVTVPLTTIANAQVINVRINGVNSAGSDAPATDINIPMGFLVGDTNGNRAVNAADISQTKSRSGQAVNASNFRSDVNANGSINAGDIALCKQYSGTALPPN